MKLQRKQSTRQSGFSLAELMVVIVIIGLLVGVVAPNVFGYLFQGQTARVKTDLINIGGAIENYKIFNAVAPDSLEQLIEPDPNSGETYLQTKKIPVDPWGNEYQYEPPAGSGESFRLYSLGEDGQIGGTEKARDLTWEWAKGIEEE